MDRLRVESKIIDETPAKYDDHEFVSPENY